MARIAVIGAGMGAMAAAARLAVAGNRVAVYERAETYGGGVRRYERDGFAFDTGPGLLRLPAVYRDLFVKTGREPLERCVELTQTDPAARHHFADGTSVTLPSTSRAGVIAALDTALGPGSGVRWSELVARARTVWEATRRPLLEEPLQPGHEALEHDPYPALRRRGLLRRRTPELAGIAADELRDARLAALLESCAGAYGFLPGQAPASAAVLPYLEETFGTWYVRGGMRELATAVYQRCLARRVEFHFGTAAERPLVRGGRAVGVELSGGGMVEADAVVWGGGPAIPGTEGTGAGTELTGTAGASARFTVLLALRGARPADTVHRTVVHGADRRVTVLRPDDPALRPDEEHETAVLSVVLPATATAAAVAEPERLADELLAAVDAAGLGLGARVLWRVPRTPRDNETETGTPGGLVPTPALAGSRGAYLRAPNQASTAGLYRVGGWSHPGGGLAHAGMSGALAAGLFVGGADWRGSQ
ncbi:NAD(P)/FAD-dependent oxidoreductase [Streptomyces sp. N2-109]|uniref:NAD(P)/FAD-dependent oxidoreductase n=1 Tax=Streptomyces gossypii TaxID=2883101 RepID=A0ABT2JZM3_9ACTN|nr:NAD(P)/FAD-dependent oxidoreductase [Streptomyces gossypii]MCT2593367.1 NAD(P)/FAD-dependent oxidoreductase [Streptomyces gossypii]